MTDPIKEAEQQYWNSPDLEVQHRLIAGPVKWEDSEAATAHHWSIISHGVPVPSGAGVLEIGCGLGRILKYLTADKSIACVAGVDISSNMLVNAKKYLGQESVRLELSIDEVLPFDNDSYDFVYSFLVFQHIPTRERVNRYLAEVYRVLKPGGYVRIQTYRGMPHDQSSYGFTHGYFYTSLDELAADFSAAGFEIMNRQEDFGHQFWLWITAKK